MKLIKKQIFSSEKMRNSGNYIYDYAHSFFGEDFNPMSYTNILIGTQAFATKMFCIFIVIVIVITIII